MVGQLKQQVKKLKQWHSLVLWKMVNQSYNTLGMLQSDPVECLHLLENSLKHYRGFHNAMKTWKKCFISFIKYLKVIITSKKQHYFTGFNDFNITDENDNSQYLTTGQFLCQRHFYVLIALWKHDYWPMTACVLSKVFYKYIYIYPITAL